MMYIDNELKIIIAFGGSECEKGSLLYVASKLSRKLRKKLVSNTIFDLNDSETIKKIESDHFDDSIFLVLDPYYYVGEDLFDIREKLDKYKIKYTGPSIESSKKTANKDLSKKIVNYSKVHNIKGKVCTSVGEIYDYIKNLNSESFIVKPVNRGGGEDVFLVQFEDAESFDFESLLNCHNSILVEEYIKGTELALPILKCRDEFVDFPIVGITLSEVSVFNNFAKSNKLFTQVIPYELSKKNEDIVRSYAKNFYEEIGFRGLLRVDFILRDDEIYFLEANSYPSLDDLSGISIPSAKEMGLDEIELINMIIGECKNYV